MPVLTGSFAMRRVCDGREREKWDEEYLQKDGQDDDAGDKIHLTLSCLTAG